MTGQPGQELSGSGGGVEVWGQKNQPLLPLPRDSPAPPPVSLPLLGGAVRSKGKGPRTSQIPSIKLPA